jgi:hypothetical protein
MVQPPYNPPLHVDAHGGEYPREEKREEWSRGSRADESGDAVALRWVSTAVEPVGVESVGAILEVAGGSQ